MMLSRRLLLGLAGVAWGVPAVGWAAPGASAVGLPLLAAALPFSGSAALIGDEVWRGIQLAADAVNGAGGVAGVPVQLIDADMQDSASATAAVNGLITGGHAGLVFGSGVAALSYPASAAAELAQTPFIELTAPADGICTRGFNFLLRTGPASIMAAQLAVATIKARFAGRRLGLLYNNDADKGAFAGAVLAALQAAGLKLTLAIGYPDDVEDLHDQAGRLMRAQVDVLLHAAGLDDALGLACAGQMLGWRPGVLLGYGEGYAYRETALALGGALDGAYVIAAPFYPASAAGVSAAYTARFGMAPRAADSLTAYVGAKLVFDTLNGVDGDVTKLLAALRRANLPKASLANGFGAQFDRTGQNMAAFFTLQQWRGAILAAVA